MRTQCCNGRAQAVGRMRIIDIHGRATFGDDGTLQSSPHWLQPCQMRQQALHLSPACHNYPCRDERICGLIGADERQLNLMHIALNTQLKRLPKLGRLAGYQLNALALFPHGDQTQFAFAGTRNDLVRPNIVCPDHRAAIGVDDFVKQAHFGLKIIFHRPVIIKMVTA